MVRKCSSSPKPMSLRSAPSSMRRARYQLRRRRRLLGALLGARLHRYHPDGSLNDVRLRRTAAGYALHNLPRRTRHARRVRGYAGNRQQRRMPVHQVTNPRGVVGPTLKPKPRKMPRRLISMSWRLTCTSLRASAQRAVPGPAVTCNAPVGINGDASGGKRDPALAPTRLCDLKYGDEVTPLMGRGGPAFADR
jgi:hypothetical protein